MQFRKGDKVTVTNPSPENAGTKGKTGVVFYPGPDADGLVTVKGIDGRVTEAVKGYRGFTPDEITRTS